MVEISSPTLMVERISQLIGAEAETNMDGWQFKKKRTSEDQKRPNVCVSWSLELTVTISLLKDNEEAVNEAEVFLLPEELADFTSALIQNPILFPSNYSQQLTMERGMYCARLKSEECPVDFTERLMGALRTLG